MLDLLKDSGMESCKLCATPIEMNHRLKEDDSDWHIDAGRFQRLVGRPIYLSLSFPNMTYAVGVVSQFMHTPIQDHMEAIYQILRYLKGYLRMGLLYKRYGHHRVEVYTDAD